MNGALRLNTKITVDKDQLLKKLRENRERHSKLVAEARAGYIEKAKVALDRRLDQLRNGKLVGIVFRLSVPLDYTKAYDQAIQMFEMDKATEIQLTSDEFRCLVMDKWDWTETFVGSNSAYSAGTRRLAEGAGAEDEEEEIGAAR